MIDWLFYHYVWYIWYDDSFSGHTCPLHVLLHNRWTTENKWQSHSLYERTRCIQSCSQIQIISILGTYSSPWYYGLKDEIFWSNSWNNDVFIEWNIDEINDGMVLGCVFSMDVSLSCFGMQPYYILYYRRQFWHLVYRIIEAK